MKKCCNNLNWQFIKDVQKARGCEFTYGKCNNCGKHLIHKFITATIHEGNFEVVSDEFVSEMLKHDDHELKKFMKKKN